MSKASKINLLKYAFYINTCTAGILYFTVYYFNTHKIFEYLSLYHRYFVFPNLILIRRSLITQKKLNAETRMPL